MIFDGVSSVFIDGDEVDMIEFDGDVVYERSRVSSVSLTADKSVLSYADRDTCILTATVLNDNGAGVSGETVTFEKDGTVIGTSDTNSSGLAQYTYASAGVGDVSFLAKVRTFVSETYSIEDCLKHIDTATYNFPSSSIVWQPIADLGSNLGDVEISLKMTPTRAPAIRFDFSRSNQYENYYRMSIGTFAAGNKFIICYTSSDTPYEFERAYANTPLNISIIRQNNQLVCSIDSNTKIVSDISDLRYIGLVNWNNSKSVTVTDLKVKAL